MQSTLLTDLTTYDKAITYVTVRKKNWIKLLHVFQVSPASGRDEIQQRKSIAELKYLFTSSKFLHLEVSSGMEPLPSLFCTDPCHSVEYEVPGWFREDYLTLWRPTCENHSKTISRLVRSILILIQYPSLAWSVLISCDPALDV